MVGDNPNTANQGLNKDPLIKNSVVFKLSGLPADFILDGVITNVSFQYGTDLTEPNVPVPEPGILILLGLSMTAIGVASRYVRKI
jgi:hypothetical protein